MPVIDPVRRGMRAWYARRSRWLRSGAWALAVLWLLIVAALDLVTTVPDLAVGFVVAAVVLGIPLLVLWCFLGELTQSWIARAAAFLGAAATALVLLNAVGRLLLMTGLRG